jgi:hypothetical protein
MTPHEQNARIEIAYADHRDDRMIIVGAAAWPTMAEQEHRFAELPEVEDSDFIADFYDEEGTITKDKYISAETVETVLACPLAECIEDGRRRENDLTAMMRARTKYEHPR